jgi:hypothetical protein
MKIQVFTDVNSVARQAAALIAAEARAAVAARDRFVMALALSNELPAGRLSLS